MRNEIFSRCATRHPFHVLIILAVLFIIWLRGWKRISVSKYKLSTGLSEVCYSSITGKSRLLLTTDLDLNCLLHFLFSKFESHEDIISTLGSFKAMPFSHTAGLANYKFSFLCISCNSGNQTFTSKSALMFKSCFWIF